MRRLPDGTPILIRRIRPGDRRLLAFGLRYLSALTVQQRFLGPKPRFTKQELRYLTEVDGHDHVALVAESPTQPVRHLIAVARFVRSPEDPEAAEVAIVVMDSWQGRGLGSLLARELAARARGLGIKRFTATMASDNLPALRLMEKLAGHLEQGPSQHGVSALVGDLAA
jgi:RimJ/RimL family protein N-acetyltransferase